MTEARPRPSSRAVLRLVAPAALCLALAACLSSPPAPVPETPAAPAVSPQQRLAAVTAAAGGEDNELSVQPLRDPMVEDLRAEAARAIAVGDAAAAAAALDRAIALVPEDPAVLQERAEAALLQADYAQAETLARRAFDLGSKVGPLCRRHWATIEQARLARNEEVNAHSARAQLESCTVAGFKRM